MLKLNEIVKYLITQPHQTGSQVPAFLKLKAGFVGENGDPDALYKKAQGKKYNSPRNLRTLVIGDVGGLIRYHVGLGNSSDGKLFYSLKHKLEGNEDAMLSFIKGNVKLPIEELNNQLQGAGFLKSRSDAIIIQNGISKRNLKFLASGGWGDNSYDFAYIEEILIDSAWAKMMGLLDRNVDLLGVVPIIFGGSVDIAKKFPRLMHIGILNDMEIIKDMTKSGSYKYMLLEAFGNPEQVGVQKTRLGISYVFKTPEQVFKTFKPSREVYELDGKINSHFKIYKGTTVKALNSEVKLVDKSKIEKPVGVVEKPVEKGECPLLVMFLKQVPPEKGTSEEVFKSIINKQAGFLIKSTSMTIGYTDKVDVLKVLKALTVSNMEIKLLEQLKQFVSVKFKENELKDWFYAAFEVKQYGINKFDLGVENIDEISQNLIEMEQEDNDLLQGIDGLKERIAEEAPIEFKIYNRSYFLKLKTVKGFINNFNKIIKPKGYKETVNKVLDDVKDFEYTTSVSKMLENANDIVTAASFVEFESGEAQVELMVFMDHWSSLIFRQTEVEKNRFLKQVKVYTDRLESKQVDILKENLEKALSLLEKADDVVDSLEFIKKLEGLKASIKSKLSEINNLSAEGGGLHE